MLNDSKERKRRPFPRLNSFRDWVSEELRVNRKTRWPVPTQTPFVRITSCNEDLVNRYRYFTLGLHGFDSRDSTNLFEPTYGVNRDIVGYAYKQTGGELRKELISADQISFIPPNISSFTDLPPDSPQRNAINNRITQAQTQQMGVVSRGAHPIPGITGVSIRRSGLAAPMIADISWQCYNQQQLEFLRNHFLVVGSYIVIEWGTVYHNRPLVKTLDFSDPDIESELAEAITRGRKFVISNYSKPNSGNYDFLVGQVGNFTIDFEPMVNIYKCTTKLVSLGENMWGLGTKSSVTLINKKDDTSVNRVSDIHSYFQGPSNKFDQLLGKLAETSDGTKYVRPQTNAYNKSQGKVDDGSNVGTNPLDHAYISWSALVDDIINDLIEMFSGASEDSVTQEMYDYYRSELRTLLSLGGPPLDTLPDDIFQIRDDAWKEDWVGNHPFLRSTDPHAMILITPSIAALNPPSEWLGNGIFGDTGDDTRAKLTTGVWLHAEMVRNAFLTSSTLQSAFQAILSKLNASLAGYWQLQLYYDDELATYKIIDYKYDGDLASIKFYVFNSNKNDHHNETVDISMDTAFPPELITQMMVTSLIQTASPAEQKKLFERYPLINNTSPFMFAINWTSLKDLVKDKVKTIRNSYAIPKGTISNVTSLGKLPSQTTSVSIATRLGTASQHGGLTGPTPSEAAKEGVSKGIPGSFPQTALDSLSESLKAPTPRTNPFATIKNIPVASSEIKASPLPDSSQLVVTSGVGAREASSTNPLASTDHKGVDLRAAQGTRVASVKSGVVKTSLGSSKTAGNLIEIDHGDGSLSRYMHLSKRLVVVGQKVSAGSIIGESGGAMGTSGAGSSRDPHLHFEMLFRGVAINPIPSLQKITSVGIKQPSGQILFTNPLNTQTGSSTLGSESTIPNIRRPGDEFFTGEVLPDSTEFSEFRAKRDEFIKKFGNDILKLIYPMSSILRNLIVTDGYQSIDDSMSNSFISPFPTQTSVDIKVPGISGLSISDGFLVDKLPFIFADYGVFQITDIKDIITSDGWYTNIKGYFKMIWPSGRGAQRDD